MKIILIKKMKIMKNENEKTQQDIKPIEKTGFISEVSGQFNETTDESFFENLVGKTYREYAQYMTESRRLLIDNINNLVADGEISEELYKKIFKGNGEHFIKNFPNSLPNTSCIQ
jgi:hypothetical protein